ncbi:MAG: hypothetical protein ABL958_02685 [Bdellovibrionia bacterium]
MWALVRVSHVAFLLGYLVFGVWTGCSEVAFQESPKAACNGFDKPCTTTTVGNAQYNTFDYNLTVNPPQADILFIDDNSGSMYPEQQKMGDRFPNFLASLSNLDWRIAITTTDVTANGARGSFLDFSGWLKILTPSTPNKETLFLNTIRRNETGNGDERGVYAANLVIDNRDQNGFFRPDAHFAVVVLSDEDERSNAGTNNSYPLESYDQPQTFKNNVASKLGASKTVSVHSIVIRPGDQACLTQQNQDQTYRGYFGTVYAQLTQLTSGVLGDICASDYGAQLTTIGNQIVKNISSYKLACVPTQAPGMQPVVTVQPAAASTGTIRDDQVFFDPPLAPGTQVRIQYSCEVR